MLLWLRFVLKKLWWGLVVYSFKRKVFKCILWVLLVLFFFVFLVIFRFGIWCDVLLLYEWNSIIKSGEKIGLRSGDWKDCDLLYF